MQCTPEEVGYWYLRLNGFLTTANFIVHPDEAGNQLTDIDILGIRFAHRAELLRDPMQDDPVFSAVAGNKPFIIIGEIKTGQCEINQSLRNSDKIHRVLRAIGVFPQNEAQDIARIISQQGNYSSNDYFVSLCSLGNDENPNLTRVLPGTLQITWAQVLSFIYRRFERYRSRKADHDQWDRVGQLLWNAAAQIRNEGKFIRFIQTLWRVQ